MNAETVRVIPVLPSADIARDVAWYQEKLGLILYSSDRYYAVLYRDKICLHLQWHAGTADDPLLGGSVVRIHLDSITPLLEEFIQRGTVTKDALRTNTPWKTNEFGFQDLNRNSISVVEELNK